MAKKNLLAGTSGPGSRRVISAPFSTPGGEAEAQIFRSLADHSQEFIGMCDLDFKPFYVNEAGRRLVGLGSLAEACAVKVQDYFFPEDQRYVSEEFFPKVRSEGQAKTEIRFRHFKSGAAVWMSWDVFRLCDAQGQVSGYATVSRDITEWKRTETELRESRGRLQRVLEVENVGVMFWDLTTGRMTDANDTFLKMMGYSRREVEAGELTWEKLTPPEYVDASRGDGGGLGQAPASGGQGVCSQVAGGFSCRERLDAHG